MPVLFGIERAVARSVIKILWDAGYSSTGAFRLLIKEGYSYPEKSFLKDWREIVSVAQRETFFSTMPKYVRPTRAMMIEKATPLGDKYTYTFQVNLYDPVTGERLEGQFYSVGEDKILSVREAEEDLAERLETVTEKGMKYESGVLTNVKRRE